MLDVQIEPAVQHVLSSGLLSICPSLQDSAWASLAVGQGVRSSWDDHLRSPPFLHPSQINQMFFSSPGAATSSWSSSWSFPLAAAAIRSRPGAQAHFSRSHLQCCPRGQTSPLSCSRNGPLLANTLTSRWVELDHGGVATRRIELQQLGRFGWIGDLKIQARAIVMTLQKLENPAQAGESFRCWEVATISSVRALTGLQEFAS